MLKTLLKAAGLMAFLAWFGFASAANMGGINVTSALGHPLQAEISLAELGQYDKSQLNAKLASVNEFKNAGIDYPYSLPKLSFSFETRSNGAVYLKILSAQPVNDPFVSILVELSWPSGKLLREYTFLLDPAGFVADQPKVAEVKPVEPVVPILAPLPAAVPLPIAEAEPLPVEPAPVAVLPLDEDKKEPAEPVLSDMAKAELAAEKLAAAEAAAAAENVVAAPAESAEVSVEPLAPAEVVATTDSVLVEKGDTLGKIAKELKPVDVSLERMLVAMYRANAKQFDGRNMNRIRTGKVLRMPEAGEIDKVTQTAAVKEIRAQVADWQDYRQKLAATQSAPDEAAPKQESAGKISAAVAEKAPVVKESAKEVLRLSKGESLGDKAVAGGAAKSKQDSADDAAAKAKQLQEDKKKIANLENISKDASKLVELKSQPAAASAPVAATKPAVTAAPAPAPVVAEEDILTTITDALADPIVLGGVVALVLALGGLGFVISRRGKGTQKKSNKKVEDVGSATGSWRTPVAPSPDTGDFTQAVAAAPSQTSHSSTPAPTAAAAIDDVDPISEADLFLNFGRDTSAEEILKDALVKTPANNQVKLKLLSIYVNRKDSKSFSKYAQEVKDSGDAAAWERAAVMGRELDPSNPTYGGAKGEPRNREAAKPEVDFDLGMGGVSEPANKSPAKDMTMDFDLTGAQPSFNESSAGGTPLFAKPKPIAPARASADVDATSILSRADLSAALAAPPSSSPMDFDVSGILPGEVKQMAESKTMDFDISGIMSEDIKSSAQSTSMDFDLTGSHPGIAAIEPESSPATSAMNFNDLVFEIPTSEAKPIEPVSAPVSSADEGMAFTIDFPTGGSAEETISKPAAANKVDIDFGSIDINFDNDSAPASAGADGKDDQWHEVATKLDLAKAYQEMGDADGAREILEEVMRDGDDAQKESAQKLMQQITA